MEFKDYRTLGVAREATVEEIEKASHKGRTLASEQRRVEAAPVTTPEPEPTSLALLGVG